jgi:GAF domain-containing protein
MSAALQALADELRADLAAARVTVRLRPEDNMPIVAEALGPGVRSLRDEHEIDQNAAATVRWVVAHRATLAVEDARTGEPATPAAMTGRFGLRAFMIAPLLDGARLLGTVSVHVEDGPRPWSARDMAALEAARDAVLRVVVPR